MYRLGCNITKHTLGRDSKDLDLSSDYHSLCEARWAIWILCNLVSCLTVMLWRVIKQMLSVIDFLLLFAGLFLQRQLYFLTILLLVLMLLEIMRDYRSWLMPQIPHSKNNLICKMLSFHWQVTHSFPRSGSVILPRVNQTAAASFCQSLALTFSSPNTSVTGVYLTWGLSSSWVILSYTVPDTKTK